MSTNRITHVIIIQNSQGMHARPAELFARMAMQFDSQIELVNGSQRVDAKSILHLLTLGARQGTELVLEAVGDDAQQAVDALVNLVENHFECDDSSVQN
jgi:phosphotransferase system HPr (HPr) family protein